jgi:structure-specific recognition protein 1
VRVLRESTPAPRLTRRAELRLANSGLAWRGDDSEFKVAAGDIKWAQWLRVARNYQLRIGLKDHARETLDGFMREVRSQLFAGIELAN